MLFVVVAVFVFVVLIAVVVVLLLGLILDLVFVDSVFVLRAAAGCSNCNRDGSCSDGHW